MSLQSGSLETPATDFAVPGILDGQVMSMDVLDPTENNEKTSLLEVDDPFDVLLTWQLTGAATPVVGGFWVVSLYSHDQDGVGAMKGLAVSGSERWPELPDVPTVGEAGVPAALADTWQGIMAPVGTPKEIIERLAAALTGVMRRPDVRERLLHAGFHATGRGPEAFHRRIVEELPKWKNVIQQARITVQ